MEILYMFMAGGAFVGAIYILWAMLKRDPVSRFVALAIIVTIGFVLLTGCSSAFLVNQGIGDPVKWAGNRCVEIGYTRNTDEWRECIFKIRDGVRIEVKNTTED
jgi:hypothetical protein